MPTFFSSDLAAAAARSLRELAGPDTVHDGLTHATLGELQSSVTSIARLVDTLSGEYMGPEVPFHLRADAQATADELHQASTALEAAATWLAGAARIAERVDTASIDPPQPWVNVVSLEGSHATGALHLLANDGPEAATVHLSQWDEGTDTDNQAMIQRMAQDRLPVAPGDQAASYDVYTIIANPAASRIAMYRLIDDEPIRTAAEDHLTTDPLARETPTPTASARDVDAAPFSRRAGGEKPEPRTRRNASGGSWFDPPTTGGTSRGQGRSL